MAARAIVEIKFGPMQGVKALITSGSSLRVGRTDFAKFVVPHDNMMSAEHFELSWDGKRCYVKDLGSAKGTRLAGEPVQEAEVQHGGWIRAGATDFMVFFEGRIPPGEEDEGDEDEDADVRERRFAERTARVDAAEKALVQLQAEARNGKLYAILDAARDDRILQLLKQNVEVYRSLYEGIEGETLAEVAPYLTGPLEADSALLSALVREGWGKRWGIYCVSREGFREVRRHFRRFLMVEEEETGERMYFRFYDPGVMGAFAKAWTVRQFSELGGDKQVDRILAEGLNDGHVISMELAPC